MGSKVNLKQLKVELSNLQRWQALYKLLKVELTKQGYWQNKPRGDPSKGGRAKSKNITGNKIKGE